MDKLITDLRGALRMLWKSPGFAVIAIATLAVGIGGNAVMFSILRGVLLQPLAYPAPDQIVQVWVTHPVRGQQAVLSPYNIEDWAAQSKTLDSLAGYGFEKPALLGRSAPVRITAVEVMGLFFETFRTSALMGRTLTAAEEEQRARVGVLSYSAWQRLFAADPEVVGKSITLDSGPVTIVGVMPAAFTYPYSGTDLWTPPSTDWLARGRNSGFLFGVGRVRDGVSLPTAQAEANAIAARLRAEYPGPNRDVGFRIVRLQDQIVGRSGNMLIMLMAAVVMVLLIACTNVISLLLTRANARRREMATRAALGASRLRLARQVLTESCVLAVAGGTCGLALGYGALRLLITSFPAAIPRLGNVRMDGTVLLFTLGVAVIAGLLFGLAPTLSFSPAQMIPALKEGGAQSGSGHRMLRRVLVGAELALSLALLISATLVLRSLWLLHRVDPGFATTTVLGMRLSLPEKQYPDFASRTAMYQRIIDRLRALPGVTSVGGTNDLPFSGSTTGTSFSIVGRPATDNQQNQHAGYRTIAGNYFQTMGIPLLRGRLIGDRDTAGSPRVTVIAQALARHYFREQDPLGQRLRVKNEVYEIVGVVGNVKHDRLTADTEPEIYLPDAQSHVPGWMSFVVGSSNPNALIPSVRAAVAEVAPEQPLYDLRTMDVRVEASFSSERLTALIIGAFAGVALLLAVIGVYGVFAFSVSQRTREIGIRMALGADAGRVLAMFLGESTTIAAAAAVAGVAIAALSSRLLRGMLFEVKPVNLPVYIASAAALVLVALAGSYIPARRAARVEPTVALRCA
jgi:putative ABC transport system permease protein